jgi:SprT protein
MNAQIQIENKVSETWLLARKNFKSIALLEKELPKIFFMKRNTRTAGLAKPVSWELGFNLNYASCDLEMYLNTTVVHEVAHLVANCLYASKGHDKKWKLVMTALGAEPERCCQVNVNKFLKGYVYKCKCQEHVLTTRRHNTIVNKGRKYFCLECKTPIVFDRVQK